MISQLQNGYRMLSALHDQHCGEPSRNYFGDWCQAVKDYSAKRRQSLVDLAVDATNLAHSVSDDSSLLNDPLVAAAIRDTNPSFDFASPPTGEALEGAVNAAKGKYFEYLVVERLNNGERVGDVALPDGFTAKVAESMTQPAWDVQILDHNSRVADYLQLKATDNASYIKEALDRYPDITILTTDEAAHVGAFGAHVLDADIRDNWLDDTIRETMGTADVSFGDAFVDAFSPLLSLAFIVSTEGYRVTFSEKDSKRALLAIAHRGTRTLTSQSVGALVYAAGGGWLTLPAAVVGGLVYERLAELYEASSLIEQSRKQLLLLRLAQQDNLLHQS